MDKRTILAFVLIFVIILIMPSYLRMISHQEEGRPPAQPVDDRPPMTPQTEEVRPLQPKREKKIESELRESVQDQTYEIDTELYHATVSSRGGGTITSFVLKEYQMFLENDTTQVELINSDAALFPLLLRYISIDGDSVIMDYHFEALASNSREGVIRLTGNDSTTLGFVLKNRNDDIIARKNLTFTGNTYLIGIETDLRNLRNEMAIPEYEISWDGGLAYTEQNLSDEIRYSKSYALSGGELEALDVKNGKIEQTRFTGKTDWTAIRTKYFAAAILAKNPTGGYRLWAHGVPLSGKEYYKNYAMHLSLPVDQINRADLYVGPLDYTIIRRLDEELVNIMSLGKILRPISKAVLWIFIRLRQVVPNYGWVLIIFAFLVKIVLYPLTNKSMRSMKEMQRLQPRLEELRAKYKNDPQKMSAEQMKLYKEHGVNPMGGCLPLLLQMPILIALFTVFRTTIELRHAPFILWITDLSAPDTVYTLPFSIPLYGKYVNVLPIIMALSTILQQKLSSTSTSNPQQRMMMYLMPVMFFFIFNQFPSGLNLYYTLFNILTILQQKYLPARSKPKKKRPSTLDQLRKLQAKTKR